MRYTREYLDEVAEELSQAYDAQEWDNLTRYEVLEAVIAAMDTVTGRFARGELPRIKEIP